MKQATPRNQLLVGALTLALTLPATSFAFGMRGACREDVAALCPDADSRREAHRCLRDHQEELSTSCLEKLQKIHDHHAAVREACEADVQALCPDSDSRREVRHCLRESEAELSDACAKALDNIRSRRRCPQG